MGFGTDNVISDDSHVGEFICKICSELIEYTTCAYTVCTHVFCAHCLDQWFSQGRRKCPACQRGLKSNEVWNLREANPLAFRLLGRVRVRCPLNATERGCDWTGDYSEVHSHLINSKSHTAEEAAAVREVSAGRHTPEAWPEEAVPEGGTPAGSGLSAASACSGQQSAREAAKRPRDAEDAAALKEQGNAKFQSRAYADAVTLYTKAIALAPGEATYLLNRAAAHLMRRDLRDCIDDCEAAARINPALPKAYLRLSKARVEQGDFHSALIALRRGHECVPGNAELQAEAQRVENIDTWVREGEAALQQDRYADAAQFFSTCLQQKSVEANHRVLLLLAKAELRLGRSDGVLRRTRDILRDDRGNVQAYAVRGEALLLSNDLDQAATHAQEAVRLDPDDTTAARLLKRVRRVRDAAGKGRRAAFERRFEDADGLLSSAITEAAAPRHAPLSAVLNADRAAARLRLGRVEDALKDCAVAIYAQDDCRSAWLTKASCLNSLGRHKEAMDDMSHLLRNGFESDEAVRGAYHKAEFHVRKEKRPDYYGLLGCGQLASEMEIKQAYKQRALVLHPDKIDPDASAETKTAAEEAFKRLGDALEILTDEFKRKLWDEGYDKKAIGERVEAANRAARERPKKGGCCGGGCG